MADCSDFAALGSVDVVSIPRILSLTWGLAGMSFIAKVVLAHRSDPTRSIASFPFQLDFAWVQMGQIKMYGLIQGFLTLHLFMNAMNDSDCHDASSNTGIIDWINWIIVLCGGTGISSDRNGRPNGLSFLPVPSASATSGRA